MVEMIRVKVEVEVTDHEATGLILRRWRRWHSLTQTEVAEVAGMSNVYLSQLESGKCPWTESMFARVVKALQTLTGEAEPCIPG
jgi:predicted transcriptional regulator